MFQINRRLIVVQTLIIHPPFGLGDLLLSPGVRPFVCLSACLCFQDTEEKPNSDVNQRAVILLPKCEKYVLQSCQR